MNSDVRIASARIVHVQFLCAFETNGPASATNRFFDVVRLAVRVQHRRARIAAHPRRADFVDDPADRLEVA